MCISSQKILIPVFGLLYVSCLRKQQTLPRLYSISLIIILWTYYEKPVWLRAFNQHTKVCILDMVNEIFPVNVEFIIFFLLFKHIFHCFPQNHLGLRRGLQYYKFYPIYSGTQTNRHTNNPSLAITMS